MIFHKISEQMLYNLTFIISDIYNVIIKCNNVQIFIIIAHECFFVYLN